MRNSQQQHPSGLDPLPVALDHAKRILKMLNQTQGIYYVIFGQGPYSVEKVFVVDDYREAKFVEILDGHAAPNLRIVQCMCLPAILPHAISQELAWSPPELQNPRPRRAGEEPVEYVENG
jgi:hypothetical protein